MTVKTIDDVTNEIVWNINANHKGTDVWVKNLLRISATSKKITKYKLNNNI